MFYVEPCIAHLLCWCSPATESLPSSPTGPADAASGGALDPDTDAPGELGLPLCCVAVLSLSPPPISLPPGPAAAASRDVRPFLLFLQDLPMSNKKFRHLRRCQLALGSVGSEHCAVLRVRNGTGNDEIKYPSSSFGRGVHKHMIKDDQLVGSYIDDHVSYVRSVELFSLTSESMCNLLDTLHPKITYVIEYP